MSDVRRFAARRFSPCSGVLSLGVALVGCAGGGSTSPTDSVAIAVAPLTLPGVGKVCYDVRVTNAAQGGGDVVWSRGAPGLNGGTPDAGAICSDTYGNSGGGDIAYVGPCDADGQEDPSDAAGERTNSITLWFDGLYDTAGAYLDPAGADGWQNPCPLPGGCTLDVLCEENADAPVKFDFTVMRDASQGFFDVAVSFEDIFCSAKLDTCYAAGAPGTSDDRPIALLFGADGVRDWTAVFGFACTAGSDAVATRLYYGPVAVTCGATTFTIDPTVDSGNASVVVGSGPSARTVRYGVYRGTEELACGGGAGSCRKAYWNLALSLDDLAAFGGICSFGLSATANDDGAGFTAGLPTTTGLAYPYIDVAATLTTGGAATCQQNPLNATGSAVRTVYKGSLGGVLALAPMCAEFDGEAVSATGATSGCGPAPVASCGDGVQNQGEGGIDCGGPCTTACAPVSATTDCLGQAVATSGRVAFGLEASLGGSGTLSGWYAFAPGSARTAVNDGFPDEISYYWPSEPYLLMVLRHTDATGTRCFELDPGTGTIFVMNDYTNDGAQAFEDQYSVLDATLTAPGSADIVSFSFLLDTVSDDASSPLAGLALPLTPPSPSAFATSFVNLTINGVPFIGTLTALTLL